MKMSAISREKKMIAKQIVAVKIIFSLPRFLVLYREPPPPNAAPKPLPFCCNRIEETNKIANITCRIGKIMNKHILAETEFNVKHFLYII